MLIERNIGDKIHFIAIHDTEGRLQSKSPKIHQHQISNRRIEQKLFLGPVPS